MKPKTRQTLLIAAMVICGFFCVKQYLPMIQLPTANRVAQKQRELKSLQNDLMVEKKTYQDRADAIQAMQSLTGPFWIPSSPSAKVDQEILAEFNRITRLAQLSTAANSQKIDVAREKNGSSFQEVTLSVDFKNVSMRDLTRFFTQLRTSPKGEKFRWEYCKINPDNPRTPNAANMSARFKILVLNNDAMAFLGLTDSSAVERDATSRSRKN